MTGRIKTFSDLIRSSLKDRYPGIPGSEVKALLDLRSQLEFAIKQKRKEREKLKDKGETVMKDTEVEVPVKHSKKEQGVQKLTPFLAQTIKECIDISAEPDDSLLIKVRPNVPLHQALTEDELDLHTFFREEESDVVSEYSLISEEEEDPFTPAAATLWQKETISTLNCRKMLLSCWEEEEYLRKLQKRYSSKLWMSRESLLQYLRNCMKTVQTKLSSI